MALSNYEIAIRKYIENRLIEEYPELAGADNTALQDLFINPYLTILKPIIEELNRIDFMQDLGNAAQMSEDELDRIGVNNYGIARRAGQRASDYVYVEMEANYVGPGLTIIGPITVSTSDGLKFSSNGNTVIRYTSNDSVAISGTIAPGIAADYLNTATGRYEFPVYVTAEEEGDEYNVDALGINTLITSYPLLTGVVFNRVAFTNGTDKETNIDYGNRIMEGYLSRSASTFKGYRSYVLETFPSVKDVYVAGFGDSAMIRDRIILRENGVMTEKSIGGKVDLYIKGNDSASIDQVVFYKSDKIRLQQPLLQSTEAIVARNITNPNNNDLVVVLTYENPDTKTGWIDAQVIAGPSNILPEAGDEIEFKYISYLDESYSDTMLYSQSLYYKAPKFRINVPPFKSITKIYNETKALDVPVDGSHTTSREYPIVERGVLPSQTGATTTQVKLDATNSVPIDGWYDNFTIKIIGGTGSGQTRTLSNFSKATFMATVNAAWSTKPDTTSVYAIYSCTNKVEHSARDTINVNIVDAFTVGGNPAWATGDKLIFTYIYNKIIDDVQNNIDANETRMITTDVLSREATPIYIYIGLKLKCVRGRTISTLERTIINSFLEDICDAVDFNSELQATDIISLMYKDSGISEFLDYVNMPFVFFASDTPLSYTEDQLLELSDKQYVLSKLSFTGSQYPVLGMCAVTPI